MIKISVNICDLILCLLELNLHNWSYYLMVYYCFQSTPYANLPDLTISLIDDIVSHMALT